jgi:DNA-binding response OmpR family regulator
VTKVEPHHILVVNDTPEILELFRELLEGDGYRVSLYSYAFRDLEEVKRVEPDLMILDSSSATRITAGNYCRSSRWTEPRPRCR